jgi:hypothetical protein
MKLHRYEHKISRRDLTNWGSEKVFTNHYIELPSHIDSVMAVSFRIPTWRKLYHRFRFELSRYYFLLKYLVLKRKIVWTGSYIPLEAMVQYDYNTKNNRLRLLGFMYDGKYGLGRYYITPRRRIEVTYISESKDRDDKLKQLGI